MDTLDYIVKKYDVDPNKQKINLPIGRFRDFPKLLCELGVKVGAEIGVYEGRYSTHLLKYNPSLKLYGIDLWEDYNEYLDFRGFPEDHLQKVHEKAKEATKGYNCELIKGYSRDVVKQFEDNSLDFVFIDGNHQFEYVVEDILLWSRKVRTGGIVSGHDYRDWSKTSRWDQISVIPAVDGWVFSHKIKPLFIVSNNRDNSWFYVK